MPQNLRYAPCYSKYNSKFWNTYAVRFPMKKATSPAERIIILFLPGGAETT